MSARRIHIVGGPGSGKSFVARRLAERYGIPVTDLDRLFWRPSAQRYGIKTPPEERDAALKEVLAQPSWIIEGVYHSWVQRALEEADVILIMSSPVRVRQWRIIRRFLRRRIGVETSKHESFSDLVRLLRWNRSYDEEILAAVRRTLADMGRTAVECRRVADALKAVEDCPASRRA